MSTVRAAAVGYLNARPLYEALADDPRIELECGRPSAVAARLREGLVDLGLVPVIELLRQPELEIVSDAAIACDGAVDSVLLILRRPLEEVRRLAIDAASRTSQILAQVILEEAHGLHPEVREAEADQALGEEWADAVLVIGDRALELRAAGHPHLDLGAAWKELTGRAFVFAVWAARPEALEKVPDLEARLERAREVGLGRRAAMARREAVRSGLDGEALRLYLTERIRYRLATREREGLRLFLEKAERLLGSRSGS